MTGSSPAELEFFAACPRHVPDLLAGELRALGLNVTREHPAGVSFTGPIRDGYLACLASRTASRVLLTLGTVPLDSPETLYDAIRAMPWEEHLATEGTLAIDVVGQGPTWLRHTQFAAQKSKDAIVDRIRERSGARPSVDLVSPDLRLNLSLMRERASIAIDLSGDPLHRRGYRQSGVEAPLKENLAAALLLRCGWPAIAAAGGAFVDPMCGSGTLVIEAALMAADVAPGLLRRRFGFERWLQHEPAVWEELRAAALARRRTAELGAGRFHGYDRDQTAIRASLANSGRSSVGDHLLFERRELAHLSRAAASHGLVLVNPPYGARLDEAGTLEPMYALLGTKLMECFPGWEAGVFTGNPPLGRALRLRAYRAHTFFNGPIECRLLRFELLPETVEPDAETIRQARLEAARARPGASMFGNRLRKNFQRLEAWAKREDVACFRVYDADMPEYAFAVDLYGNDQRWACVQEYAAPATVSHEAARGRRDEVLAVLPGLLGLPPERVVLRVRRRQRGGEQYEKVGEEAEFHTVREGRYRFLVNFTDYLDTGLFLDHRLTRQRIGQLAAGRSFLNLFAYTGTATVHAAGGGATVLDHRGHVAHLPRLGEAQPRAERPRRPAARLRAGGLPRLARGAGPCAAAPLRSHLRGPADAVALEAHDAGVRRAARPRGAAPGLRPAARARRDHRVLEQLPEVQARPGGGGALRSRGPVAGHAAGGLRAQSADPRLLPPAPADGDG